MPVYLTATSAPARGPDGQGWNRLSVNAHMGDASPRCALRPRTYATLRESQDTRRAAWNGDYDICTRRGQCDDCPIYRAESVDIGRASEDRILVRFGLGDGLCHEMVNPDTGLEGWSYWRTWEDMANLTGWEIGRRADDQHSKAFWLIRVKG